MFTAIPNDEEVTSIIFTGNKSMADPLQFPEKRSKGFKDTFSTCWTSVGSLTGGGKSWSLRQGADP